MRAGNKVYVGGYLFISGVDCHLTKWGAERRIFIDTKGLIEHSHSTGREEVGEQLIMSYGLTTVMTKDWQRQNIQVGYSLHVG